VTGNDFQYPRRGTAFIRGLQSSRTASGEVHRHCKGSWRTCRACAHQLCPHPSCFLGDLKSKVTMFIAALFTTAPSWKQPRCPSVGKWINKLWYVQMVDYYSALKRNELSSCEKTWRKFKCIFPSPLLPRSQSEKATDCSILTP